MSLQTTPFKSSERGQIIVMMVLVFIGLLGAVALAVDGGRLYLERRSAQNAADNAALAGAYALCSEADVNTAVTQSAVQSGFNPSADSVDISINNPPASGPNAGNDDYVAVTITSRPSMAFAPLVYQGVAEASASAVAECIQGGGPLGWGNGLIALNPSSDNVMYGPSSGCVVVNGGGIFVNSTHSSALYLDGGDGSGCPSGTRMKADWIEVVGGASLPSWVIDWGNPALYMSPYPPQTGLAQRTDPLAGLAAPSAPAFAGAPDMPGCSPSFIAGVYSAGSLNLGNHWCTSQVTLRPGHYTSFTITSDAGASNPVIMQPGLYYVDGSVQIDGASRVQGNGVTFYVASGSVTIGGSGQATLAAPDTGTYTGLVFFMARGNTSNFIVNGGASLSMTGTIYAPDARIESSGSGNNKTVNGQMIANRFFVTGGGQLALNYDPDLVYSGGGSTLIQLSE
jgi:hypothetical protein